MNRLVFRLLIGLQKWSIWPSAFRGVLLRLAGISVGRGSRVMANVHFSSDKVRIGDGCFINLDCLFEGHGQITLANGVFFGPRVSLITSSHRIGPARVRAGELWTASVSIGEGAWIGAGAMILPNVEITGGCVVAAGSLVTKTTQRDGLYLGSPAAFVRAL